MTLKGVIMRALPKLLLCIFMQLSNVRAIQQKAPVSLYIFMVSIHHSEEITMLEKHDHKFLALHKQSHLGKHELYKLHVHRSLKKEFMKDLV